MEGREGRGEQERLQAQSCRSCRSSCGPCFTSSFACPEVVVTSILKRAFTPAALSRCCCSLPCSTDAAPSSISSRFDIPSHVSVSARRDMTIRHSMAMRSSKRQLCHWVPDSSPAKCTSEPSPENKQHRNQQPDGSATKRKMGTTSDAFHST